QREVAERFFAEPRTKEYGAVSVLVQLAALRTGFHAVSRSVFRPPPNVDSALVAFKRKPPLPNFADVKKLVSGAFAHRRKTIGNSLELTELVERETVRAYLVEMGCNPDVRAEMLRPEQFVELAQWLWENEPPRRPR
ncbi:MAG TPA: rRNA adenine N-6-methyltransferase family protein, partial [Gaiellaceae bacterium]